MLDTQSDPDLVPWSYFVGSKAIWGVIPDGVRTFDVNQRLVKKHGKAKALSVLSQKLGRAVYFMLKRQQLFDMNKFLNS